MTRQTGSQKIRKEKADIIKEREETLNHYNANLSKSITMDH